MKVNDERLVVFLLAIINVILHLLPSFYFEYHRDELLYFSLCDHLDFGYATTAPFIGFVAYIAKSIFGYSVFSVRFFPALMSGLLVIITSMMATELNGNSRSRLISAIGVTGTMFLLMIYGVFTPYSFDIFFWTLAIYFLIRYVKTDCVRYLLFLSVVVGFGFLNKYSVVFLVVSILIVLPFTKYKQVFLNKYLYIGLLLSLLIASPNIIWQIFHHFPVFDHLNELVVSQFSNVSRVEFIVEQFIFLLPFTFIIIPGIFFFLRNKDLKDFRFLLSIVAVVIILFIVLRGKSFYICGLYPLLIVIGALFVDKAIRSKLMYFGILGLLIIFSIVLLPLSLPVFKPNKMISYFDSFAEIIGADFLRKDEDGKFRKLPQVNSDMLGWIEITDKTNLAWSLVSDKSKSFIFCTNYGQAGAISVIGKKYGLPEPVSFSDAYRYWLPPEFKYDVDELVYVVGADAIDSRNFTDTKAFFNEVNLISTITNPLAIEYETKIYILKNPKGSFNKFWKVQINDYERMK